MALSVAGRLNLKTCSLPSPCTVTSSPSTTGQTFGYQRQLTPDTSPAQKTESDRAKGRGLSTWLLQLSARQAAPNFQVQSAPKTRAKTLTGTTETRGDLEPLAEKNTSNDRRVLTSTPGRLQRVHTSTPKSRAETISLPTSPSSVIILLWTCTTCWTEAEAQDPQTQLRTLGRLFWLQTSYLSFSPILEGKGP